MTWLILLGLFGVAALFWWAVSYVFKPLAKCPVCNGVCGVNVADPGEHEDWFDCDFCNATGYVTREKVKEHGQGLRKED